MPWPADCFNNVGGISIPTLKCVPAIFQNIVTAALAFSGAVAVFFIIWSGFKYINSGGDPKQVDAARQTLTYAIIGLMLVLLSFLIINLIGYITGVKCINAFGFQNCQ